MDAVSMLGTSRSLEDHPLFFVKFQLYKYFTLENNFLVISQLILGKLDDIQNCFQYSPDRGYYTTSKESWTENLPRWAALQDWVIYMIYNG